MIRLDRIVLTAWNTVYALRQVPDALVVTGPVCDCRLSEVAERARRAETAVGELLRKAGEW